MIWRPPAGPSRAPARPVAPSACRFPSVGPRWAAGVRRGGREAQRARAGGNAGPTDGPGWTGGTYQTPGDAARGAAFGGGAPAADGGGGAPWPGAAAAGASDGAGADADAYGAGAGWQAGADGSDAGGAGWPGATDWGEYEPTTEWGQAAAARGYAPGGAWGAAGAPADAEAGPGPASAWAGGAAGDGAWPPGGGPAGGYSPFDAETFRGGGGATYAGYGAAAGPPPGAGAGWAAGFAGGAGPGAWPGGGGGGVPPLLPSDVTLITPRDAELVLPVIPTADQARHYRPKTVPERVVQVLGSIGVSAALSKSALLAGPALLYPLWGPWIRAGVRNAELYLRQFKSLGLWRAQVLSVDIQVMPYAYVRAAAGSGVPYTSADSVSVVVGDPWPGGARAQLRFPYAPGCEELVAGESAELLVLCRDAAFQSFKVVREVYFPQSGLWLAEYPFVNRDVFLDISLAVERGRQMAARDREPPPPPPPPPGAWGPAYDVAAAGAPGGTWADGYKGVVLEATYSPVEEVEPAAGGSSSGGEGSGDGGYAEDAAYGAAYGAAEAETSYGGSSSNGSGGNGDGGGARPYDGAWAPADGSDASAAAAAAAAAADRGYWINEEGYAVPWRESGSSSGSEGEELPLGSGWRGADAGPAGGAGGQEGRWAVGAGNGSSGERTAGWQQWQP